jgi:hypothetical protein
MNYSLLSLFRWTTVVATLMFSYQFGYRQGHQVGFHEGRWQQSEHWSEAYRNQWRVFDEMSSDYHSLIRDLIDDLNKLGPEDEAG